MLKSNQRQIKHLENFLYSSIEVGLKKVLQWDHILKLEYNDFEKMRLNTKIHAKKYQV